MRRRCVRQPAESLGVNKINVYVNGTAQIKAFYQPITADYGTKGIYFCVVQKQAVFKTRWEKDWNFVKKGSAKVIKALFDKSLKIKRFKIVKGEFAGEYVTEETYIIKNGRFSSTEDYIEFLAEY